MDKKRILIFIDWYLPGYRAGGPIRSCANMIAALSSKFEFYVITRNTDYLDDKPYPDVHTDKWNVLPDGSWVHYLSNKSVNRNKIEQLLLEKNYDAIYINGIYSRFFSMIPLQLAHKHKMNAIVAPRGMLAPGAMGIKPLRKRLYLQYAKSAGLFSRIRFHATGTSERDRIRKVISADAEIVLAPNLAKQVSNSPPAGRLKKSGQLRIIHVARIAPEKNLHFALEILANVNGDVKMDIFGPVYNKTYWDKCLSLIADLPANIQ
ncbi:MAG: hypothetical protein ACE5DN_03190, partial [Flavobacteriales bacterium]